MLELKFCTFSSPVRLRGQFVILKWCDKYKENFVLPMSDVKYSKWTVSWPFLQHHKEPQSYMVNDVPGILLLYSAAMMAGRWRSLALWTCGDGRRTHLFTLSLNTPAPRFGHGLFTPGLDPCIKAKRD